MRTTVVRAGLAYFGLVFAAGFLLGTLRVLWLAPRVGERAAELAETPLMLAASLLAARWVVQRFQVPATAAARLQVGLLALVLLLSCELTVVLALRGLSLDEYLATRDPLSGAVYLAALLAFAAMPWLLAGRGGTSGRS
jgi:hypothetical protein